MIIRKNAYPRGGLVGNPSDGYFGKTIAFSFTNFSADVVLYESPELEVLPSTRDHSTFLSIGGLARDVQLFGYYGGIRLLKAAIKRFHDHCLQRGIPLREDNFTVRYSSNIPHLVGLAGSSAIITACMRCLMDFYGVTVPREELANLILEVETKELGISAGLQDRVAQVYEGLVYMDFDRELMESRGYGTYEPISPDCLPPLYVAYRADLSGGSEVVHNRIRERFNRGDSEVLEAIDYWRTLTDSVREKLESGNAAEIGPLLDANFDQRARIAEISEGNRRMVDAARSVGASAKFTGSGGAIVGTYTDEAMFEALRNALEPMRVEVFKPAIAPPVEEDEI